MIKNLLEQQANQLDQSHSEVAETNDKPTFETASAPQYVEVNEAEDLLESSGLSELNAAPETSEQTVFSDTDKAAPLVVSDDETIESIESDFNQFAGAETGTPAETINSFETNLGADETPIAEIETATDDFNAPVANEVAPPNFVLLSETVGQPSNNANADVIFQSPAKPESFAETARNSGLAYAAAITLFASVVFMLIIGWFADLLFGSSPWGKVGGVVIGSLIGFIQLFRITSQIFKNND